MISLLATQLRAVSSGLAGLTCILKLRSSRLRMDSSAMMCGSEYPTVAYSRAVAVARHCRTPTGYARKGHCGHGAQCLTASRNEPAPPYSNARIPLAPHLPTFAPTWTPRPCRASPHKLRTPPTTRLAATHHAPRQGVAHAYSHLVTATWTRRRGGSAQAFPTALRQLTKPQEALAPLCPPSISVPARLRSKRSRSSSSFDALMTGRRPRRPHSRACRGPLRWGSASWAPRRRRRRARCRSAASGSCAYGRCRLAGCLHAEGHGDVGVAHPRHVTDTSTPQAPRRARGAKSAPTSRGGCPPEAPCPARPGRLPASRLCAPSCDQRLRSCMAGSARWPPGPPGACCREALLLRRIASCCAACAACC